MRSDRNSVLDETPPNHCETSEKTIRFCSGFLNFTMCSAFSSRPIDPSVRRPEIGNIHALCHGLLAASGRSGEAPKSSVWAVVPNPYAFHRCFVLDLECDRSMELRQMSYDCPSGVYSVLG